MKSYFVRVGAAQQGPFPHAEIAAALRAGRIPGNADIIDAATGDIVLPDDLSNFAANAPSSGAGQPAMNPYQPYSQGPAWHYGIGAQRFGPVPLNALQSMISSGQLGPSNLVWCEGWPGWVPAGTVPMLFPQGPAPQGGMQLLVPLGPQSALAIAAGYLGIGSLFCGPFTGIPAIVCGLLGLRDIARNPHKRGKGRSIFGIAMGAVFTIIFVILFASGGLRN